MQSIRELRESKGIKQVAVASYLGVSRQTYARYEADPERLTIAQARLLCEFLGCSFDFLLSVRGN